MKQGKQKKLEIIHREKPRVITVDHQNAPEWKCYTDLILLIKIMKSKQEWPKVRREFSKADVTLLSLCHSRMGTGSPANQATPMGGRNSSSSRAQAMNAKKLKTGSMQGKLKQSEALRKKE